MTELVIGGSGSGKSAYAEKEVLAAGCGRVYYLATMRVLDEEMERKVARHRRMRAGRGWLTIEQPVDIGQAADVISGAARSGGCAFVAPGPAKTSERISGAARPDGCTPVAPGPAKASKRISDTACLNGLASVAPGPAKASKQISGGSSAVLLECLSNLVANEMFRGGQIVPEDTVVQNIVAGIRRLMACTDCLVLVSNSVFSDGITYDEGTEAYIRALGRINQEISGMADRVTEVVAGIPVRLK